MASMSDHTDLLFSELQKERKSAGSNVHKMMAQMKAQSKTNMTQLERIMDKNTTRLTKRMDIKMLLGADLSNMSAAFREKARIAIEKHFEEAVLVTVADPAEEVDLDLEPKRVPEEVEVIESDTETSITDD